MQNELAVADEPIHKKSWFSDPLSLAAATTDSKQI